jgi:hypothetical protein
LCADPISEELAEREQRAAIGVRRSPAAVVVEESDEVLVRD